MKTPKVHIYGLGNVGYHLYLLFKNKEVNLGNVFSDYDNDLGVQVVKKNRISDIHPDDFVFVTMADKRVVDTISILTPYTKNIVITAGGIHKDELPENVSVFYPLYSFSKYSSIDWTKVPIFLEGFSHNSIQFDVLLNHLQLKCSFLNSDDRNKVHLAAVFVNNFTNANLIAAWDILQHFGINKFEHLIPILSQTAEKVLTQNPKECQTGPAVRGDEEVINYHLDLLSDLKDEKELYVLFNKYIKQKFNK